MRGPIVLYEGSAVILGETRFDAGDDDFSREAAAEVWPSIAFPRQPLGIRPADVPAVFGDANTALLFTVGRPYRRISIDGRGSWTEWIEVRPDVLAEMIREYQPEATAAGSAPFRLGRAPAPGAAYLANRRARHHLDDGGHDALALEETALAAAGHVLAAGFALCGIARERVRTEHDLRESEIVFDVQACVNRRLERPLSLAEISDAVGVSPYHLCRVFRRKTGAPIHRYRDRLRLCASLERLADSSGTILDIAHDLGYANEGHFSNAFRRGFGVRPGTYRRTLRKGR